MHLTPPRALHAPCRSPDAADNLPVLGEEVVEEGGHKQGGSGEDVTDGLPGRSAKSMFARLPLPVFKHKDGEGEPGRGSVCCVWYGVLCIV